MGVIAKQMIHDIITVLVDRNAELLDNIAENEEKMDKLQTKIDEETIRLIGVYTPVAVDLRTLLMVARMNVELERIGDQTMNIAFYAKTLLKEKPLKKLINIPRMAEMAELMLSNALESYVGKSHELAMSVIDMDNNVDQLNDQTFRLLMTYVIEDPRTISRVLELILIARALERIADHAVNIAEDVIYIIKGKDIRHSHDGEEGNSAEES